MKLCIGSGARPTKPTLLRMCHHFEREAPFGPKLVLSRFHSAYMPFASGNPEPRAPERWLGGLDTVGNFQDLVHEQVASMRACPGIHVQKFGATGQPVVDRPPRWHRRITANSGKGFPIDDPLADRRREFGCIKAGSASHLRGPRPPSPATNERGDRGLMRVPTTSEERRARWR